MAGLKEHPFFFCCELLVHDLMTSDDRAEAWVLESHELHNEMRPVPVSNVQECSRTADDVQITAGTICKTLTVIFGQLDILSEMASLRCQQ